METNHTGNGRGPQVEPDSSHTPGYRLRATVLLGILSLSDAETPGKLRIHIGVMNGSHWLSPGERNLRSKSERFPQKGENLQQQTEIAADKKGGRRGACVRNPGTPLGWLGIALKLPSLFPTWATGLQAHNDGYAGP